MLSKTYEIIRDPKKTGIKMRINLSKPLLVITMANKVVAQANVNDRNLNKLNIMLINDADLNQTKLDNLMFD